MRNSYKNWNSALTIGATMPFVAYLFVGLKDPARELFPCFKIEYLKIYSLMLIAFISGYLWAYSYQKKSIKLALLAVVGPILLWLNFIFNHSSYYFVVDIVYYVILLFAEGEKYDEHSTPKWYYKLRILATIIVVISLIGITYF